MKNKIIIILYIIVFSLVIFIFKLKLDDNSSVPPDNLKKTSRREATTDAPLLAEQEGDISQSPSAYAGKKEGESKRVSKPRAVEKRPLVKWKNAAKIPPGAGKLAIIIDDLGQSTLVFEKLISLDFDITYSILPQLPHSATTAEAVVERGREVMLHLPMEPKNLPENNPGKGALLIADSPEVIRLKMTENLISVPGAAGVNNHMGSVFTLNAPGLRIVMEFLSENALFFIDSKTAPGNLAKNIAKEYGARYIARNIFLDNMKNEAYITRQLFKAVRIAQKRGWAIAIGHPYAVTYYVLAEYLQFIEKNGVEIVSASQLL